MPINAKARPPVLAQICANKFCVCVDLLNQTIKLANEGNWLKVVGVVSSYDFRPKSSPYPLEMQFSRETMRRFPLLVTRSGFHEVTRVGALDFAPVLSASAVHGPPKGGEAMRASQGH